MNGLLNKKTGSQIFISDIVGGINRAKRLAQSEFYELVQIEVPKPKEEIKVEITKTKVISEEIPSLETPKKKGRKPKSDNLNN